MPQKEQNALSVSFQKKVKQTTPFDFFFFNKWNPAELREQVHSMCPSPKDSPKISPLPPAWQRSYHQVQKRNSRENQPATNRVEMEPPVPPTQTEMADTSLLCYAWLTYKVRWKPVRAALQAKGQCGHFLPCSETSELMMEMVIPSQRVIVLQAEQCYHHWW